MTGEQLMELKSGTKMTVTTDDGQVIDGELTFQVIPVNELTNAQQMLEQYDGDEEMLVYSEPELYDVYAEYNDAFVYGLSHLQPEDYNVEPRDIGRPTIKKGTPVVCFEFRANEYKLRNDD